MGGVSDHMLAFRFVHRLAGNIKWTLYVLSRMDMLSIDQLLAQVITRDEECSSHVNVQIPDHTKQTIYTIYIYIY